MTSEIVELRIPCMHVTSMVEVLRQRVFISHDHKTQRGILNEYTIRAKRSGLTDVMILSDIFLPNLMVNDEGGSTLSVMTTNNVKDLIRYFIEKDPSNAEKLELLKSRIESGKLHMIWIKIPKSKAMVKNEIRTITLNHSPYHEKAKCAMTMHIKNQPYPLYYTLFTPDEFDFGKTQYRFVDNDRIIRTYQKPEYVQKYRTHDSNSLRIKSGNPSFQISYSFKPTSTSTAPTKMGICALVGLSLIVLFSKHVVFSVTV